MVEPRVVWGPCCFCAKDISPTPLDPCRVQVTTTTGKWQVWSCYADCFKKMIENSPDAPGLFGPAHF